MKTGQSGFTLLELLIVIAILATLVAVVATNLSGKQEQAAHDATKISIQKVSDAIAQYRSMKRQYPRNLQDLLNQPAIGISSDDLKDQWGNDFIYRKPGTDGRLFDLISYGADGKPGGEGWDEDIYAK